MTSLANTIRWTRRGNSQIRNKSTSLIQSPADSFKLPSLNALNKSIKYGDLTFATSRDMLKLRKEPDQVDNIEEVSAHHSLMVIRKKYDNMNKTREAIQREVEDLESKREKFLSEKNRFQEEREKGAVKVVELGNNLMDIKHSLEETEVEKKVMLSMVERLKHDKVVYDLRKYRLEKELAYIQRQKQIILKENAGKMEEEDKTRKIHQKLIEHLESQQREREAHVKSLETMISEKVSLNESEEMRRSEMKEIAQNALQDKDLKQKNWYKVLLCSRFVEKLLRDKMNREMLKFNTVEMAFKNIKTSTGVSNTTELVKKFLNKETAYGELLGKIAENERTIAQLKSESEDLAKERRKLEAEQDVLSSNKSELKDLAKEEKQMHQMAEKAQQCHMLVEKLRMWGAKSIKKFNSIDNLQQQVEIKSNPKDIIEQLKLYFQRISQSIDQPIDINPNEPSSNINIGGNNLRISLSPHQQHQNKHNERKMQTNIQDQEDFINNQRSEIIKNNDKFMKQVRKKHQDIKKAKLQAQPKKKEVIAQKPKPQPIQS